jgi:pyruvate/2-oxoglutarate dehydrogenase complex dihydrolipoamide dehydrogenase (E3) component
MRNKRIRLKAYKGLQKSVNLFSRKSAEIKFYDTTIIRTVTTKTKKKDNKWILKIKTYLESSQKASNIAVHLEANMKVEGGQTILAAKDFSVTTSNDGTAVIEFDMVLSDVSIYTYIPLTLYT